MKGGVSTEWLRDRLAVLEARKRTLMHELNERKAEAARLAEVTRRDREDAAALQAHFAAGSQALLHSKQELTSEQNASKNLTCEIEELEKKRKGLLQNIKAENMRLGKNASYLQKNETSSLPQAPRTIGSRDVAFQAARQSNVSQRSWKATAAKQADAHNEVKEAEEQLRLFQQVCREHHEVMAEDRVRAERRLAGRDETLEALQARAQRAMEIERNALQQAAALRDSTAEFETVVAPALERENEKYELHIQKLCVEESRFTDGFVAVREELARARLKDAAAQAASTEWPGDSKGIRPGGG